MPFDLLKATDYKDVLRHKLGLAQWGGVTQAAAAAGCQRSYLSQVMHGSAHLTQDQAFQLSKHWELPAREAEYFLLLVDLARAASPAFKAHLERKLAAIRQDSADFANLVARRRLADQASEALYYSSWIYVALHIAVSIPALQTVEALAGHFQLPPPAVVAALQALERLGLVRSDGDRWRYAGGELHVPKDSPLVTIHHQNWRQRAVTHAAVTHGDGLHYSLVQAVSRGAADEMRQLLLRSVAELERVGGPSTAEQLVCLNLDFFPA